MALLKMIFFQKRCIMTRLSILQRPMQAIEQMVHVSQLFAESEAIKIAALLLEIKSI